MLDKNEIKEILSTSMLAQVRPWSAMITRYYDQYFNELPLSAWQLVVLMAIYCQETPGVTGIAQDLDLDRTTVKRALIILERKQYIQKDDAWLKNPDKRFAHVKLTASGNKFIQENLRRFKEIDKILNKSLGEITKIITNQTYLLRKRARESGCLFNWRQKKNPLKVKDITNEVKKPSSHILKKY